MKRLLLVFLLFSLSSIALADPLRLGIFPRRGYDDTVSRFQPLAALLERELGSPVELMVYRDFDSFQQALRLRRFDLVHLNHSMYIRAHRRGDYDVIAMNEEFGRRTLSGALFTHVDSGLMRVEELRGHKVVFGGGSDAFVAHIVNRYLLMQHGLDQDDYRWEFSVNPPNALLAAYFRRADVGGAGDIALEMPAVRKVIDPEKIRVLARSEPLPQLPWAVRGNLEPALKRKLTALLIGLSGSEEGRGVLRSMVMTDIHLARDEDYDPARKIISRVQGNGE